jgi:hypothetical protein
MKKKPPFRNAILITSLLAVFSLTYTTYAYFKLSTFVNQAIPTKGEVIGFEKSRKIYHPKVQFIAQKKDTIRFTAHIGVQDTLQLKTGSLVKVLYHPKNPQAASIDDFWHIWQPSLMVLIFGVAPLLFILFLRWVLVGKQAR